MRKNAARTLKTPAALPAALALVSCLSGCLYTTQHFNTGRILEPGRTGVTLGAGRAVFYQEKCPAGYYQHLGEGGKAVCLEAGYSEADGDTLPGRIKETITPKISLGYRLGVRGAWGPFTGVELGWQFEAPTNPATIEFDLKFGLPAPVKLGLKHSLSAGWDVGLWADNSYFLEYAASRSFAANALYANYRYTWLATQPQDMERSFDEWKFVSDRHYAHQITLGFDWRVDGAFILPDFISPQVYFLFPIYPPFNGVDPGALDPLLMDFNLGFGWNF